MKALSLKDLPRSTAIKLFELGYAAGSCRKPDHFKNILEKLLEFFPAHAVACGLGRLAEEIKLEKLSQRSTLPGVTISHMAALEWPMSFLKEYAEKNHASRDGQLYECLQTQKPNLWIDVYKKHKHSFDRKSGKGFDPQLAEMVLDYKDDLTLRQVLFDETQQAFNVSLAFREEKEARRFSHLFEGVVPYLQIAMLHAYGMNGTSISSAPSLSSREHEVLKWLIEGKSNWEIGQILSISERTAKFHVQNLMRKLRATNRAQLVVNAFRQQHDRLQ
jgi:DNA-binding CsgD family transcriptional regulator